MQFLKKKIFSNKCCFFGRYGRKFWKLLLGRSKSEPLIFYVLGPKSAISGQKNAFFSEHFLTHFITKKNLGVGGPFLAVLDDFRTKKYSIFSKKQNLKEFIAKNDLGFSKNAIFQFLRILVKNGFWKEIGPKMGVLASKLCNSLIFFDQVGLFGRFAET